MTNKNIVRRLNADYSILAIAVLSTLVLVGGCALPEKEGAKLQDAEQVGEGFKLPSESQSSEKPPNLPRDEGASGSVPPMPPTLPSGGSPAGTPPPLFS